MCTSHKQVLLAAALVFLAIFAVRFRRKKLRRAADAGARMAKSFECIGVVEHTVASDDMPILLSVL